MVALGSAMCIKLIIHLQIYCRRIVHHISALCKKYLKFKAKIQQQLKKADRTVLVVVKNDNSSPLTLRQLHQLRGIQTLQKNLRNTNGEMVKLTSLTNKLCLLEFERGWVQFKDKCLGNLTVTDHVSQRLFGLKDVQGSDLTRTIENIYKSQRLPESLIESHFFVTSYVQALLRAKISKDALVLPFGSTASGLGVRTSSDLDIVWHDKQRKSEESKFDLDDERDELTGVYRRLKSGECKKTFNKVLPIIHARVPIVRFTQIQLGVQCDLSRNSLTGVLMAEVMSWLNDYDERFYPLLLSFKLLFKNHKMSYSPGPFPSSNSIHMLVLAFLQTKGILPPLSDFFDFEVGPDAKWETTYLKECNPKLVPEKDQTCLGDLFQEFLLFCRQRDFSTVAVDVFKGDIVPIKYDRHALTILNPFDFMHNMSSNVKQHGMDRYQAFCEEVLVKLHRTPTDKFSSLWKPS